VDVNSILGPDTSSLLQFISRSSGSLTHFCDSRMTKPYMYIHVKRKEVIVPGSAHKVAAIVITKIMRQDCRESNSMCHKNEYIYYFYTHDREPSTIFRMFVALSWPSKMRP